jgi:penicillin amidase
MCDTGRETLEGSLAMMRARDVKQFFAALGDWRFPTANVIFGDSQGRIGYSAVGALPLRSPRSLAVGGAAHDGSASRFDWQAIIPQELMPHVLDPESGYLFSGNHRPIGSFYQIPIGINTGSMGDSLRSWRLRQLLTGKSSVSPQQALDMFTDTVNPARRAIVRIGYHLRDTLRRDLSAGAENALDHLEDWYAQGASSRLDVAGAELAMQINTMFRLVTSDLTAIYGGGEAGLSHFLKTVGQRLDEDPQADVSSLEQEYIDRVLANAWEQAQRDYGRDHQQWNARAREQVAQRRLGAYESLDGFPGVDPDLDLPYPPLPCIDGATVFSQTAQAYVQWVPLADVDSARSLLPPGPTERPEDVLRTVNVEGWLAGQLNPAPLTREAVDRVARTTRRLLP